MSCIFCDSVYHCSEYCHEYADDGSREEALRRKEYCRTCVKPLDGHKCYPDKIICYICLTQKSHHTVFCKSRLKAPPLFIPKIDKLMVPGFLKLFNPVERHSSLVISSQIALISAGLRPLIVGSHFYLLTSEYFKKDVLVTGWFAVDGKYTENGTELFQQFSKAIISNTFMIKDVTKLTLTNLNAIVPCSVLQLLTPRIQVFDITGTIFDSEITFLDIIQGIPNAISIELIHSNVTMGNSWPEELLQYKNGANLEFFSISYQSFDFVSETFVEMIKTKCTKKCKIVITDRFTDSQFDAVQNELLPNFDQIVKPHDNYGSPLVKLVNFRNNVSTYYSLKKIASIFEGIPLRRYGAGSSDALEVSDHETSDALKNKYAGIYFSAQSCRSFTLKLKEFYEALGNEEFEIVFVTSDQSEAEMQKYLLEAHGKWLYIPFGDDHIDALSDKYEVNGIPHLLILKPDGTVACADGRDDVEEKTPAEAFAKWKE